MDRSNLVEIKKGHSTKKITSEEFINRSILIHNNKFDYSKVEYVNNHTKVCIICPEHGEFWQMPSDHLNGHGCKKCFNEEKRGKSKQLTTEKFIEKAKKIHRDKYDYSKVNYVNSQTKVCIICPEHGEFWQTPNDHLDGCGCRKCSYEINPRKKRKSINKFIEEANSIHCCKYDYSKTEYKNTQTPVCIICPEHGEFWQTPKSHLNGRGCPHCKNSHMENEIALLLKNNNIDYVLHERKIFKNKLELDFYLPEYNIGIECQGLQHFKPIEYFGGYENFIKRKNNDNLKRMLCKKNNIHLIYYSNNKNFVFPYKIFTNKNDIINEIKAWKKCTK